ncbi:Gp19/Gp15/Gp42 family protein [Brevibacterium otitidis]|uniref:Gp19/Gp15/Gp42 family protein n=1 Tax=Brevibacterium otitidis TaxID=53364 RepID=A0ABV5X2F8_9MICO|nr:hypothetical protein GCM10023233_04920 [Brevibacterium otitidis]
MAWAELHDVEERLGIDLSEADEKRVLAWIGDAEDIIRSRFIRERKDIDAMLQAGKLSDRTLTRVVVNAVERKWQNPTGKQNERIDDYSYGLNSNWARGEVFITDEEWRDLMPTSRRGKAFTSLMFRDPR